VALNKRTVDKLTYDPDGPAVQVAWDGDLPAFGCRTYSSGRKSFVLRYRTASGRTRLHTIGRYPSLTVDQARKRALRLLADISSGADPQRERKAQRGGATVAQVADRFIEEYAKVFKRSWKDDERRLDKHVKPALGSIPIADVTREDVARLHTTMGKKHRHEANRTLALISKLLNVAQEWGYIDRDRRNPTTGIKKFPERSRTRFITEQELPRLIEAINAEPSLYHRAAILLLLLTGMRRNELLSTKWEDVDLNRAVIRLPMTKAGVEQYVPLTPDAVTLLGMIPRQSGNPHVFPTLKGGGDGHMRWLGKPWKAIRERAGLPEIRVHDLRRTVGAWLATRHGAGQYLIGAVLRHTDDRSTKVYARIADEAPAKAVNGYVDDLKSVAGPQMQNAIRGIESSGK